MLQSSEKHEDRVNASPTKRFFIAVLIKDIQLIDAIVELVDNSVDAARRYSEASSLASISIHIEHDGNRFLIRDNASGISIKQAEDYAFRFGRPSDAPATPGTVGEFGVGMKRALFKLGTHFTVTSTTATEHFRVEVDVPAWQAEKETTGDWSFPLTERGTNAVSKPTGTEVVVTNLYDYASEELSSPSFGSKLSSLIKEKHAVALTEGLQITVGTIGLQAEITKLLSSGEIAPICYKEDIPITSDGVEAYVSVTIIAGVGERILADAGWYIYCNGRQIERADQTERTGWQTALVEGEKKTPKAHWQFARFRGYVLFESKSQSVLPWNTTKTGLDVESPIYRRIRFDMNSAMREVLQFLNALDADGEDGSINAAIHAAKPVALAQLRVSKNFIYKKSVLPPPRPSVTKVTFECDPTEYEEVKDSLGVKSKGEVGQAVFRYYRESEGLDG